MYYSTCPFSIKILICCCSNGPSITIEFLSSGSQYPGNSVSLAVEDNSPKSASLASVTFCMHGDSLILSGVICTFESTKLL